MKFSNSSLVSNTSLWWKTHFFAISQTSLMEFKSGDYAGHGNTWILRCTKFSSSRGACERAIGSKIRFRYLLSVKNSLKGTSSANLSKLQSKPSEFLYGISQLLEHFALYEMRCKEFVTPSVLLIQGVNQTSIHRWK